jgi:hypothetical protein
MDRGGTIFPFRWPVDADALFRRYRKAGLVNAQFGIDGEAPLFWGYHRPGEEWNWWDIPGFCREVVMLIADWVKSGDTLALHWEGQRLHVRDNDEGYEDIIESDALGLYRFDGWTWLEATSR